MGLTTPLYTSRNRCFELSWGLVGDRAQTGEFTTPYTLVLSWLELVDYYYYYYYSLKEREGVV